MGPLQLSRQLTPEEQNQLWLQSQQGMKPQPLPTNWLDIAVNNPVSEWVGEALGTAAQKIGDLVKTDPNLMMLAPALLGMVRYKKGGVSDAARDAAESYHLRPRVDPVGAKDTVFHATDYGTAKKILESGEIVPAPSLVKQYGQPDWKSYKRLKKVPDRVPRELLDSVVRQARSNPRTSRILDDYVVMQHYGTGLMDDPQSVQQALNEWLGSTSYDPNSVFGLQRMLGRVFGEDEAYKVLGQHGYKVSDWFGDQDAVRGVSVSRVPRVKSKESKAVSFVLDPNRMPPHRPFAEDWYAKTKASRVVPSEVKDTDSYYRAVTEALQRGDYATARRLNGILREHLENWPNKQFEFENRTFNTAIPLSAAKEIWVDSSALSDWGANQLTDAMRQTGYDLPMRRFNTGREMHSGRARKDFPLY